MGRPAAIVHLGAPSEPVGTDACDSALQAALALLLPESPDPAPITFSGLRGNAVDAAVAAVVVLEDDGRFNAGAGANLRLDGCTVEMDAAVATSDGRFGGVGAISGVSNPVLVAEQMLEIPHLLLVGEGATAFARQKGLVNPRTSSPQAISRYQELRAALRAHGVSEANGAWDAVDLCRIWKFAAHLDDTLGCLGGGDTVGVCTRDIEGNFAAATSTGGTALALRGRVGDAPLYGAGLFAGPSGAVAATGRGEDIIRMLASRKLYEWITQGVSAQAACEQGVSLFGSDVPVGFIALDAKGVGAASNREMVFASGPAFTLDS